LIISLYGQALVYAVLSSNRAVIDAGYENALVKQIASFPQYLVTRNSDTRVTIFVPELSGYSLPAGGDETISAGNVPLSVLNGVNDIILRTGDNSVTITARTAAYSGPEPY